jgi:hypothetical protein
VRHTGGRIGIGCSKIIGKRRLPWRGGGRIVDDGRSRGGLGL